MTYQQALDALLAVREFLIKHDLMKQSYAKAFDNAINALVKKLVQSGQIAFTKGGSQ